jgi:hypothetical protein
MSGNNNPLDALDRAAEALLKRYPEEWGGFVCYILEALQDHCPPQDYEAFLADLQGDITTRLEEGMW